MRLRWGFGIIILCFLNGVWTHAKGPKLPIADLLKASLEGLDQAKAKKEPNPSTIATFDLYNKVLTELQKKLFSPTAPCDSAPVVPSLSTHFHQRLGTAAKSLSKMGVEPASLAELFYYIHTKKKAWREGTEKPAPQFLKAGFLQFKVEISLASDGQVYLKIGENILGKGGGKIVKEEFRYKEWLSSAKVIPYDKDQFSQEAEVLKKLLVVDENGKFRSDLKKNGLIEVYTVENDFAILRKCQDLDDFFSDNPLATLYMKNLPLRLKSAGTLLDGIIALHAMGYTHKDIKDLNTLMCISADKEGRPVFEIVLTDFEFSENVAKWISEGRQRISNGTPLWVAPETVESNDKLGLESWPGDSIEQKKELAYKVDVYSAATLLMQVLDPENLPPWLLISEDTLEKKGLITAKDPKLREMQILSSGRQEQLKMTQDYVTAESLSAVLDSKQHLFAKALEHKPIDRINMTQFKEGFKYVAEKEKLPPQKKTVETSEGLEKLVEYGLQKISEEAATTALQGKEKGTYLLLPWQSKELGGYTVGIKFVGKTGVSQVRALAINPQDPNQLKDEIGFLKNIGTITHEVRVDQKTPKKRSEPPTEEEQQLDSKKP